MTKSHKVISVSKKSFLVSLVVGALLLPVSSPVFAKEPLPGEILIQDGIAYRAEGRRLQESGDLTGAAAAYQKAVMTNPSYAEAYNDLGVVWESLGDRAKAEEAYLMALHFKPQLGDAHMNMALMYEDAGDIKKAGEHWRQRIKIGPPEDDWVLKAREKMIHHGLLTAPKAPVAHSSSATPVIFTGDRVKEVRRLLQAGEAHLQAKRYELAIQEFQNALALDPTNPDAIRWLREAEQKAYKHQVKESKKYDDAHRSVRGEVKELQRQEERAPTEPSLPAGSNIVVPKKAVATKSAPKTNIQPARKSVTPTAPVLKKEKKAKKVKTADEAMEEALIRAQSSIEQPAPAVSKKPAPVVVAVKPAPVSNDAVALAKELASEKERVQKQSSRELSQRATQAMREARYAEAADLYKQILLLDPNNKDAQQGLKRAEKAQAREQLK